MALDHTPTKVAAASHRSPVKHRKLIPRFKRRWLLLGLLVCCLCFAAWQPAVSRPAADARFLLDLAVSTHVRVHTTTASKLEVITVATAERPALRALADSSPYKFTVLGNGSAWTGFQTKLSPLLDYLRDKRPEDLVMIVDAYDVLFLPNCGRDLVKEYNKIGADIVFNAEPNCWPDMWKRNLYPPVPKGGIDKMPYLNSGVYMGRARDILYYLTRYYLSAGQVNSASFDDQRFWTDLYLAQRFSHPDIASKEPSITLDFTGSMFQILNPPKEAKDLLDERWTWMQDAQSRQVYSPDAPYQQPACLLHGPGRKHDFHDVMYKRLRAGENVVYSPDMLAEYEVTRLQQTTP